MTLLHVRTPQAAPQGDKAALSALDWEICYHRIYCYHHEKGNIAQEPEI